MTRSRRRVVRAGRNASAGAADRPAETRGTDGYIGELVTLHWCQYPVHAHEHHGTGDIARLLDCAQATDERDRLAIGCRSGGGQLIQLLLQRHRVLTKPATLLH